MEGLAIPPTTVERLRRERAERNHFEECGMEWRSSYDLGAVPSSVLGPEARHTSPNLKGNELSAPLTAPQLKIGIDSASSANILTIDEHRTAAANNTTVPSPITPVSIEETQFVEIKITPPSPLRATKKKQLESPSPTLLAPPPRPSFSCTKGTILWPCSVAGCDKMSFSLKGITSHMGQKHPGIQLNGKSYSSRPPAPPLPPNPADDESEYIYPCTVSTCPENHSSLLGCMAHIKRAHHHGTFPTPIRILRPIWRCPLSGCRFISTEDQFRRGWVQHVRARHQDAHQVYWKCPYEKCEKGKEVQSGVFRGMMLHMNTKHREWRKKKEGTFMKEMERKKLESLTSPKTEEEVKEPDVSQQLPSPVSSIKIAEHLEREATEPCRKKMKIEGVEKSEGMSMTGA
ncbi:hypothetical protein SAICODRAFT_18797 [Saitoella complicata NRRL Y-17804]|uniref:C2H2-type domain-containing protein n=1 Tax=Saitoella complicata (strain BCRC 22490 / CBS 7301 / JCM 7358 / NBRC 10748 / NRRL Y-17804) TaxID=698492 RepID=A0A0E9NRM8_SAICN|nr:uncharacterized protein SAICODRAFT_18797 [Saitoella complicata NRRL Y-17804]ODQ53775.1 hypothetical protein SAICODRAFT_18797 [Saitoella complicata NRRL Y-17804]GAO52433.1 hypothetical protein G7K_6510-t1 [Saitoella complicata NRRL Y-17804]